VPDPQVLDTALAKARQIAQMPIPSLMAIKRLMKQAHSEAIAVARKLEMKGMMKLAGSPENIEAITAFMQKRDPDFKQFRR
jgi:enoyl-CoA hydratase/carnithine racemase